MALDPTLELASLTFEEIVRLVHELAERLTDGEHLAAMSTSQAIIVRATDLGDLCGHHVRQRLEQPTSNEEPAPPAGYL